MTVEQAKLYKTTQIMHINAAIIIQSHPTISGGRNIVLRMPS